jgi:multisubunit Na+/H+ antiporter MnhG subunit
LIAWLFWWKFVASLAWVMLTLVLCALTVMSVCNILLVELLMFLFDIFWGMCGENLCNVVLLLFMVLWAPVSATLFRRAVLMLWRAFLLA